MKHLIPFFLSIVLLNCPGSGGAGPASDPETRVSIEPTFAHGTLVEYEITAQHNTRWASMRFSRRLASEGSAEITESHLTDRPRLSPSSPFLTLDEQRLLILSMMNAIHERFGTELKLKSLGASRYLGV